MRNLGRFLDQFICGEKGGEPSSCCEKMIIKDNKWEFVAKMNLARKRILWNYVFIMWKTNLGIGRIRFKLNINPHRVL